MFDRAAYSKAYYEANKAWFKAYSKRYRKEHKEEMLARHKVWLATHKEERNLYMRMRRKAERTQK